MNQANNKSLAKKLRQLYQQTNRHGPIHSSFVAVIVIIAIVAGAAIIVDASSCNWDWYSDNDDTGSKDPPDNASNVTTQGKMCIRTSCSIISMCLIFTSLEKREYQHAYRGKKGRKKTLFFQRVWITTTLGNIASTKTRHVQVWITIV